MGILSVQQTQSARKAERSRRPVVVDGIRFPGRRQANRYAELKALERAGTITHLQVNVKFKLEVNGILICRYHADAVYLRHQKRVVEDSKGFSTDVYQLKKKLMLACHGIDILEV